MLLAVLLAALPPLSLPAQHFKLDNGMTVIISPDNKVPGVAVELWYHVGSKDEEPGRTGFAHLFEHLMFMGARYVPYPGFDTIMEQVGGSNNASTSNDSTNYYAVGPSNLLETFLWLEADRLGTLGEEMTAEKLETQRKVVLNERRQSYENRPYGLADLALYERIFPEGHPYHWPVIGSAKDLESADLSDVKRFFSRWYVPPNASLAIVGDVDPAQAERLVRRYFGWLPGASVPTRPQPAQVRHEREQRVRMTDKVDLPKLMLAWTSPPAGTPGDAACDLLADILAEGKSSRLYRRLVYEKQIATEIVAAQHSLDLQSVFHIHALARPGHTLAELEAEIDAELKRLLAEGPTQAEVEAARIGIYTSVARDLESLTERASMLNLLRYRYGDPTALEKDLARYEQATPASLTEVGRSVFGTGRVAVEVHPESADGAQEEKP